MTLCKYGCGEEITWIDGKPFSLQSHFKVCGPNGRHKKTKPKPLTEAEARAELDARFAEMQQQGAVE